MSPFVLATAVAVAGLLFAEARHARLGIWIFKALASTAFVAAALARGATASGYGRAVLAGLALSWLGDLLLIQSGQSGPGGPTGMAFLRAGLFAFLVAHLAYAAAFLTAGVSLAATGAALLVVAALALAVGRWLIPHVSKDMRAPVIAYMIVISAMVSLAVGGAAASGRLVGAAAAIAFYASDLSVARDQFVAPGFANRAWGLPLYYGAQLLFVASLSS